MGSGVGRQCLLFCPARVGLVRLEPRGGLVTAGDHLLGTPIRGCGGRVQPLLGKGCGGEGLGLRLLGPAAQETGA